MLTPFLTPLSHGAYTPATASPVFSRLATNFEVAGGSNGAGVDSARDVRVFLQEIFQRSHGLDLEFLRDDATTSARFVTQLPFMGMAVANYLVPFPKMAISPRICKETRPQRTYGRNSTSTDGFRR